MDWFSKSFPRSSWAAMSSFGSIVSVLAIASTSPVATSSTTASADFASELALACSSCCWTKVCRSRSRVSSTSAPSTAGTTSRRVPGMTWPVVDTSSVDRPLMPESTESPEASSPNWPWPSMDTLPMTFSAIAPLGYWRMSW